MMGGFGMGFGWIFGILLIGLVIWAVTGFAGGRTFQTGGNGHISSGESPLDVLKKRYARGEISREQYEEMKRDLNS
ncbi:MAG: SHOCT domain-containing protein [Calditrichia bacterium]